MTPSDRQRQATRLGLNPARIVSFDEIRAERPAGSAGRAIGPADSSRPIPAAARFQRGQPFVERNPPAAAPLSVSETNCLGQSASTEREQVVRAWARTEMALVFSHAPRIKANKIRDFTKLSLFARGSFLNESGRRHRFRRCLIDESFCALAQAGVGASACLSGLVSW